MSKQTDRLSTEKIRGQGPREIFGEDAQKHDMSVKDLSKTAFKSLEQEFPKFKFRYRKIISKKEINEKLNSVDSRLGVTRFLAGASIRPDGGVIEVADNENKWRIVLICEAKHQGKDIENITHGVLVGKNKNQELMTAGNALERSYKNINEIRNIMIDEKHFPYVLFLTGSNFLTEPITVERPDGTKTTLRHDDGRLNRLDRITAANFSLPINQNCCKNIFISVDGQSVMLQAVSVFTKPTGWTIEEMLPIIMDVARTSLRIISISE